MLLFGVPFTFCSILYGIFVLKEVEPKASAEKQDGIDNPGFDNATSDAAAEARGIQDDRGAKLAPEQKKKNAFLDFFNPIVVVQCIQLITRKREIRGRAVIIILFVISFLFVALSGEYQLEYDYVRIKLNWEGSMHGYSSSFGFFTALIGSYIMISIVGKKLGVPDVMLAVLGLISSLIARAIYVSRLSQPNQVCTMKFSSISDKCFFHTDLLSRSRVRCAPSLWHSIPECFAKVRRY